MGFLLWQNGAAGGTTFFITPAGTITSAAALIRQVNKNVGLTGTITSTAAAIKWTAGKTYTGTITSAGALTKRAARTFTATLTLAAIILLTVGKLLAGYLSPGSVARDAFGRTTSGDWGTADQGGAWNSTNANNSVSSGTARHNFPTVTNRISSLAVSALDVDQIVRVKADKLAVGDTRVVSPAVRYVGSSDHYRLDTRFKTDGSVSVQWRNATTATNISAEVTTTQTDAANTWFWIRVQAIGTSPTTLRGKVWVDGSTEPAAWDVETTDSEATLQVAAGVGLRSALSASTSNAPVLIEWDDVLTRPWPRLIWTVGKALAGTLASAGALVRSVAKTHTGSIASAGSLIKSVAVTFASSIASSGALTVARVVLVTFTASIASAGALIRQARTTYTASAASAAVLLKSVTQTYSADIDFSGALDAIRIVLLSVAGTITSSAAITWRVGKTFAGSIASAGAITWSVATTYAGSLTSAGALTKRIGKAFAGSLASAGAVALTAALTMAGAIAWAGATSWTVGKSLAGTIASASAAIRWAISTTFSGVLTLNGSLTLVGEFILFVSGQIAMAGSLLKRAATTYAGSFASVGTLAKRAGKSFASSISSSGAFAGRAALNLAGALATSGAISWDIAKTIAGSLAPGAAVVKSVGKTFAGSVGLSGFLRFFGQTFLLAVDGVITMTGSLSKRVGKVLVATIASTGSLLILSALVLAGTIASASAITWTVGKRIVAVLHPVGTLAKSVIVIFVGFIFDITSRLKFGRRGRVGTGASVIKSVGTDAFVLSIVDTGASTLATVDTGAAPADSVGAEADLLAIVGAEHE